MYYCLECLHLCIPWQPHSHCAYTVFQLLFLRNTFSNSSRQICPLLILLLNIYFDHVFPHQLLPATSYASPPYLTTSYFLKKLKLKQIIIPLKTGKKKKIKTNPEPVRHAMPKQTNRIHRVHVILANYSWVRGLPSSVVDILCETPLVKTHLSLASVY